MWTFFKKDFLVYWRDRKEMLVSICAPLLLILVLGFALPNWVEPSSDQASMDIALVKADDVDGGLDSFITSMPSDLTEEHRAQLEEAAVSLVPELTLESLFAEEQVQTFVTIQELSREEAITSLEAESIEAIVTLPQGYTESALNKVLLDTGEGATIQLEAEESSLQVDILEDILTQFMNGVNTQTSLHQVLSSEAEAVVDFAPEVGGVEQIEGVEMVSAFQYFTMAIGIIFAFFVATTTASKARTEKREQVFHRILITGAHPIDYALGKAASSFCMALLQLIIVITASAIAFQLFPNASMSFYLGLGLIIIVFACFTAAIAALFTALLFRFDKDEAIVGLSSLVIIILGTIGGSFIPIYVLPEWLQEIGWMTPNGMALSILIQWIQTQSLANIWSSLIILIIMAVIVLGLSLWVFPKRRQA